MADEILSNGVIVPEKYSREWYDSFRTNLVKLNDAITAIAGKQNALTEAQLTAVNSGITSALVTQIGTNQGDIATKANDDEVVHLAGAETVAGAKTFTASNITVANSTNTTLLYRIAFEGWTFGATPASSLTGSFRTIDSAGAIVSDIMAQILASGVNQTVLRTRNTDGTNTYDRRVQLTVAQNGDTALAMSANAVADLGTSANKWKSLNGINPGALSLPQKNGNNPARLSYVDLDTTSWALDGTATDISSLGDGWLYVCLACGTDGYVIIQEGLYSYPNCFYKSEGLPIDGYVSAILPVRTGVAIRLYIKGTSVFTARYFACQGNV